MLNRWQSKQHRVDTPIFEGPLDLLLKLIERAELDITKLALAKVTEQYLTHLENRNDRNPEDVSSFLLMAARLLQIKSAALLPQSPITGQSVDDDPSDLLIQQLLEYKKFKNVGVLLGDMENAGLRAYLRISPPRIKFEPELDLDGIDLEDIKSIAYQVFQLNNGFEPLDRVVKMSRISIREKIQKIMDSLRTHKSTSFHKLLSSRTRVEIIITFLAILELVKQNIVEAKQVKLFNDIRMLQGEDWDQSEEILLEFEN